MNVTATLQSLYMMYTNAFDCIMLRQVRVSLFTCLGTYRIFSSTDKCQKFVGYLAAI
jgi:hypothetical protein